MAESKDLKEITKRERPIKNTECVYSIDEILKSGIFTVPPECVIVAFEEKGIKEATEKDARKIVQEFLKREVQ